MGCWLLRWKVELGYLMTGPGVDVSKYGSHKCGCQRSNWQGG